MSHIDTSEKILNTIGPMLSDGDQPSLRPILFALLKTGGVPEQVAEGISDILEESGYRSFRETDVATLNRRRAQLLKEMDPEQDVDQILSKGSRLSTSSEMISSHRRIEYERMAHVNYQTKSNKSKLILTEKMRIS